MSLKQLLREPLVHFLGLGGILFAIGIVRGDDPTLAASRITLSEGVVERLHEGFSRTWQRPPTQDEFRGLVQEYLKEEVLYREALEMGLDRDDQIIRRRMRQKLEFLTADLVQSIEPTEEELQAWLDADPDRYRQESTIAFTQVFLRDEDGSDGEARAGAIRETLAADASLDPELMGDPFMYEARHPPMRAQAVDGQYGTGFADALLALPIGVWGGPISSAFGLHVVRVDAKVPGRPSELSEVRDEVYRDLTSQRTKDAEQQFFEGLLAQYSVVVEWPETMDPIDLPGIPR